MENTNSGNLKVRNLEPWVIPALSLQAQKAGHKTLEGFVRQLLQSYALKPQNDIVEELRQSLQSIRQQHGDFPDGFTNQLIRDVRDERE